MDNLILRTMTPMIQKILLSLIYVQVDYDSESSVPPSSMEGLLKYIDDDISFPAEPDNIQNEEERSILQNITQTFQSESNTQQENVEPIPTVTEVPPENENENSKISPKVTKFARSKLKKRKTSSPNVISKKNQNYTSHQFKTELEERRILP